MKCPGCQAENPPQAKFCIECGARMTLTCPKCRSELPGGAKFCLECGEPVASRTAGEPRFASPESYTPAHLAERILTSRAALEGERKQVTVLFADLKGSMELLADRDPEEARKLLDPVLERMMEAVHRYEGTVNQVMGDGIMALFGAPLAHEDHAVRACYAALRMQESVGRYGDENQRSGAVPPQIRVGLNSGEVVVRSIGNDLHMDYTAVGQTTHLAARMEQIAKAGSVLVTAETIRLAEGYVQVKALGAVPLKGFDTPIEAYELTGLGSTRTRFQASAARGLTRFVGRQTELEALSHVLERAAQGHGEVVALVGEPGVGKSRLVWEFTHSHRTLGWLILESGAVSYGKAIAYRPVIDLLKAYCQIEDRDDSRKIREKVTGKLLSLDRSLEPALLPILALLDVPVEDAHWQALAPAERRQRTLETLKRLLLRESHVQPLLLVFEDLHWIDSETQATLDGLVVSLPTAPILLLVNYRPEYRHAWGGRTYYSQLRVDPLPGESAGELLDALLGAAPGLEPLKQLLIERSEGNPFFLEETVRTLVETEVLVGERGAYRLAKPAHVIEVPATVQTILAARIDRLSSEDKWLLQSASVIGESVPITLLQAISDVPEASLHRGLTSLQAAEFLYETSLFPEQEYTFKHGLTYQVAYNSLLVERRRALHTRIVEAIERLYPERLAEHVERLAQHATRGEAWEKAVVYLRQAGTKAFTRSVHQEAVAWYEQALAAVQHVSPTRSWIEQAIDLRFELRAPLIQLSGPDRSARYIREAHGLAQDLGDPLRVARALAYLCQDLRLTGRVKDAIETGERALDQARRVNDLPVETLSRLYLGWAYSAFGDYPRAIALGRANIATLSGDLRYEYFGASGPPSIFSRTMVANSLALTGEFEEAERLATEAVGIADTVRQPFALIDSHLAVAAVHLLKGNVDRGIRWLDRTLELSRAASLSYYVPLTASELGYAHALLGRSTEALPWLGLVAQRAPGMSFVPLMHSLLMWAYASEGYLLAGRVDDAMKLAGNSLALVREQGAQGHEASLLRVLGAIYLQLAEWTKAEEYYKKSLLLTGQLGMRPLVAHCHLGLGRLRRRTGQRDQAREHLSTATTMYREMDMRFWLEKAAAEMKELEHGS